MQSGKLDSISDWAPRIVGNLKFNYSASHFPTSEMGVNNLFFPQKGDFKINLFFFFNKRLPTKEIGILSFGCSMSCV